MRGNNVVGIVLSNMHDDQIHELTTVRSTASIPFGGRYRLIDFTLSNMVNSGITKVGVVVKENYQSLMDHLGSGKAWDLSRKRGGLHILPPFSSGNALYKSRIEAFKGVMGFIKNCQEEYVLLADTDVIANINYADIISSHIANKNDITVVYKHDKIPARRQNNLVISLDSENNIIGADINPMLSDTCNFGLNIYVFTKEVFIRLIEAATAQSKYDFERDIIQSNLQTCKCKGYQLEGYSGVISSLESYFNVSMDLLNSDVRASLFPLGRPINTKVHDNMPAIYGLNSKVTNSLIADGCIIDGEVENSIIFRGVKIGKGCKIKNSILIQNTYVAENCQLNYVIADKNVTLKAERTLMGYETYPVFISKGSVI